MALPEGIQALCWLPPGSGMLPYYLGFAEIFGERTVPLAHQLGFHHSLHWQWSPFGLSSVQHTFFLILSWQNLRTNQTYPAVDPWIWLSHVRLRGLTWPVALRQGPTSMDVWWLPGSCYSLAVPPVGLGSWELKLGATVVFWRIAGFLPIQPEGRWCLVPCVKDVVCSFPQGNGGLRWLRYQQLGCCKGARGWRDARAAVASHCWVSKRMFLSALAMLFSHPMDPYGISLRVMGFRVYSYSDSFWWERTVVNFSPAIFKLQDGTPWPVEEGDLVPAGTGSFGTQRGLLGVSRGALLHEVSLLGCLVLIETSFGFDLFRCCILPFDGQIFALVLSSIADGNILVLVLWSARPHFLWLISDQLPTKWGETFRGACLGHGGELGGETHEAYARWTHGTADLWDEPQRLGECWTEFKTF